MQERERRKAHERITRRIEKLESQISDEEARAEALTERFAEPEIYEDAERTAALQAEQAECKSGIEGLYETWEALSDELASLS